MLDFLDLSARRPGTVMTGVPPASDSSSQANRTAPGVIGELREGLDDVTRGQVSLLMLNTLVVALIAFYLWTRNAQGGG